MYLRTWVPIAAIICAACSSPSVDPPWAAIDSIVSTYHAHHQFDGVALVARNGQVVYEGAFGPANVGLGVANTVDTRFRVASITKIFTVILLLQLADEKLLTLDEPVGTYVAGLRPGIADSVTVWHLLTHTSGLDREYLPQGEDTRRNYTLSDLVRAVDTNATSLHRPGANVSYSNAGYVLLAGVIERVTGQRYRDALGERILIPAGMENTGVEDTDGFIVPGLAQGHRLRLGTYIHAGRGGMSRTRGNGGIYSTARDLLRLDLAIRSGALLSDSARAMMFRKGDGTFALQWQVASDPEGFPAGVGKLAWARGANTGGFRVQWTTQLDGDITTVLLANLDSSPRQEITRDIFATLLGVPKALPKTPLSLQVLDLLESQGAEAAAVLLTVETVSEGERGTAVNELVELGHHRIRAQDPVGAIPLIQLADKVYPDNPGILVSLAFAHLEAGDLSLAQHFADLTLRLDPDDADAAFVLAEVRRF